jgi:hypothetical protein
MPDITVMSVDQFDSPNGGGFCRGRAGLGVSAFGMQVEHFPPNFEHFPEATLALTAANSCSVIAGARPLPGAMR